MTLFSICGVDVKCSPLFGLLCLISGLSGNLKVFAIYTVAVLLHEAAHCIMAAMLGCSVESVELMPYGCTAKVARINSWFDEFSIALAGPVFSALTYMGCRLGGEWVEEFAVANLYIASINLLPVYPLDGGRVLQSVLQLLDVSIPKALWNGAAIVVSALVATAGTASGNPTVVVFAVFMLSSVLSRDRHERSVVTNYIRKARTLASGDGVEVKNIALWRGVSLSGALANIGGSKYVIIWVLDEDMTVIGRIEGVKIIELAASLGSDKKLGDAVALIDRVQV